MKVFPQIWQKCGRPSWWRLATCLSRGPFSVKRCSQNSQLKGLSPVWVRLCLSRLAVGTDDGPVPGLHPWDRGSGGQACLTLGAEGLATEVTLERLLARVCAQVHVEVGLLGEGVAAELADKRPLIPVQFGGGGGHMQRPLAREKGPFAPLQLGALLARAKDTARPRRACPGRWRGLGFDELPGGGRAWAVPGKGAPSPARSTRN